MAWSPGLAGLSPLSPLIEAAARAGSISTAQAAASTVGISTNTAMNSAKSAATMPCLFADRTMPPCTTVLPWHNAHDVALRRRALLAQPGCLQGLEGTAMASFSAMPANDQWALAFYVGDCSTAKPTSGGVNGRIRRHCLRKGEDARLPLLRHLIQQSSSRFYCRCEFLFWPLDRQRVEDPTVQAAASARRIGNADEFCS